MSHHNSKKTLLLVDGMALLFRAFFATSVSGHFMINTKGVPTNAVHGFVKHLLTAVNHFGPSHVAVCWDMGSKTFRTEMYESYKGNRSDAPIELIPQFDLVKEVVSSFDIPNIGLSGYEADDCIGTIAKQAKGEFEVQILTGDRDILQLLEENIQVILLQKGFGNYAIHTASSFFEEKGIHPWQMVDVKALMGDPSDNYPGVKGIGEKTALKLIQQFEHVEGLIANLSLLSRAQASKIEQDLEMLHLSRKLAEIKCDVPLEYSLEDTTFHFNEDKVLDMFSQVEFKGLDRLLPKVWKELA